MAAKQTATKPSEPDKVDAYMKGCKHPLRDVLAALREAILKTDPSIGEEVKWNAPTFFYAGEMAPTDPKAYKRYLIVSNLFKKDCIRLVFWRGDRAGEMPGFLEGDYGDGRRIASFASLDDVRRKKKLLQRALRAQLKRIDE